MHTHRPRGNILVLEDRPEIQILLRKTLEFEGFAVETTNDGYEAPQVPPTVAAVVAKPRGPHDLVRLVAEVPRQDQNVNRNPASAEAPGIRVNSSNA